MLMVLKDKCCINRILKSINKILTKIKFQKVYDEKDKIKKE